MAIDIDDLLKNSKIPDFGFTTMGEAEFQQSIQKEKNLTLQSSQSKLKEIEDLILPLLTNLYQTADNPHIYWPNRRELIEGKIKELLRLTRE